MADINQAHTTRQEVMNIIHDLEPEDALSIARSIIDSVEGAQACIWEADDIDTVPLGAARWTLWIASTQR